MRSVKLAWVPGLATLASGLVAWCGAFTGQDAFAVRALSVAVVVSLLASAPLWALLRRPLPFVLLLGAKLVVFFALAPRGLSTLGMSYADARGAGLFDAWLRYFWGLPPCLLQIAIVEGWLGSLALRGRSVRDTRLWQHRRVMALCAAVGAACAFGWWVFRGDYYLWRLHQGSAPARYSLAKVGPRVLPRLYRELENGKDREALVDVIVDIRHRLVAKKIGSVQFTDTEAAQVGPDPAMVAALSRALSSESEPVQAKVLVDRIERADFDTVVAVFCDAFPRAPPMVQAEMVSLAVSAGRLAYRSYDAPRDTPDYHHVDSAGRIAHGDIAAAQSEMRAKLHCALPLVEQTLVREAPSWPEDGAPLWSMDAIGLLAWASPLPKDSRARLLAVAPRVKDGYALDQMLSRLQLLGEAPPAATASLVDIFRRSRSENVRSKIINWARSSPKRVVLQSFWCGVFPLASNEQRHSLMYLLDSASGPRDPCVASTLMSVYEKAVVSPSANPPLWLVPAREYLKVSEDVRIAPWAAALAKRADKNQLWLLRDLY